MLTDAERDTIRRGETHQERYVSSRAAYFEVFFEPRPSSNGFGPPRKLWPRREPFKFSLESQAVGQGLSFGLERMEVRAKRI